MVPASVNFSMILLQALVVISPKESSTCSRTTPAWSFSMFAHTTFIPTMPTRMITNQVFGLFYFFARRVCDYYIRTWAFCGPIE